MSIGGRLWKIARNVPDFGIQTADLFIDAAVNTSTGDFGIWEAWVNSWEDNVMGESNQSGTGERSVIGTLLGPQGLIGAAVEAIPPEKRQEMGADKWNLLLSGLDFTWTYAVSRPIATLATIAHISKTNFDEMEVLRMIRSGEMSAQEADSMGLIDFVKTDFDPTTWKNAWNLTKHRSPGQATLLAWQNLKSPIDLANAHELEEFKETAYYRWWSGVIDFGINIAADPPYLAAKFGRARYLNKVGRKRWEASGGHLPLGATLDDSGQLILGAYGNPRLEPFMPYQRPPARRDAWLMRTPSRKPVRIGGERLHTWIADKQAAHPRLTTLLGGDTLDMLTIPGGRTIGSPGRLRDELFYENYSLTPKWLDNVPTTMDETLAGSVDEANRIKAVFDDEMKKDMANTLDGGHNELPLHLTHTAEGVVDPVFGMDRPTTILMEDGTVNRLDKLVQGKVSPSLGAGRWETLDQGVLDQFILWRNKWRKSRAEIEQSLNNSPFAWDYERLANDNVLSSQQRALANDIKDLGQNIIGFQNIRTWSEFLEELDNMFPAAAGIEGDRFITRIRHPDALDEFITNLLDDVQQGNLSTGRDPITFESFDERFYPEESNALRWGNDVEPFSYSFWSGEVGSGGISYTSIRKSIEELQELIKDASNPFRTLDELHGQGGDVVVWNNWTDDPMWEAGLLVDDINVRPVDTDLSYRDLVSQLDELFPGFGFLEKMDVDYLTRMYNEAVAKQSPARPRIEFDPEEGLVAGGRPTEMDDVRYEAAQEEYTVNLENIATLIREAKNLRGGPMPAKRQARYNEIVNRVKDYLDDILEMNLVSPETGIFTSPTGAELGRFRDIPPANLEMILPEYARLREELTGGINRQLYDMFEIMFEKDDLWSPINKINDDLLDLSESRLFDDEMTSDQRQLIMRDLYGGGLWDVSTNVNSVRFINRLAKRFYDEMPKWGAFYRKLSKDALWSRAQIYARIANAGAVDSASWLPYYNFIRMEMGNLDVINAVRRQAEDMSHVYTLLRDVEAPFFGGRTRPDDGVGSRDPMGLQEGTGKQVGGATTAPNLRLIDELDQPVSLHWHFRELRLIREMTLVLQEAMTEMGTSAAGVVQRRSADLRDDLFGLTPEHMKFDEMPELTELVTPEMRDNIKAFSQDNIAAMYEVLQRKEAAHTIFIQNYLFSPRALAEMATTQGKNVIQDLLESMEIIIDEGDVFRSMEEGWYFGRPGTDIPDEVMDAASEIILSYEDTIRTQQGFVYNFEEPRITGDFVDFTLRDVMPTMPPGRGFPRRSADDVIDFAGYDPHSPFAELLDRINDMEKFPWQAVLGTDDLIVKNLVQSYNSLPASWDRMDIETTGLEISKASRDPRAEVPPTMLSPQGVQEMAAQQLTESMLASTQPHLARRYVSAPETVIGVKAKTLFSKSGPLATPMNSRAFRLFEERIPHGIINVQDRSTLNSQIGVMFRELDRIDVSGLRGESRQKRWRPSNLWNPELDAGTIIRTTVLESGEPVSLLDIAIKVFRGSDNLPANKVEAKLWADEAMIDLLDSDASTIAHKIDQINDTALTASVEAVVPHSKFAGVDWGQPHVRAAMKAILRGDLDGAKRLLDEAADATERRFTNADFTEIVIPGAGETQFIRKPISPSQVRQTLVMPRWDKFDRLITTLRGDLKTIIGPEGLVIEIPIGRSRAAVRAARREAATMWKRHVLLTPRWQMVVNIDSQLRNIAHLGAAMALGRLGGSFDQLRVRWLRKAGVDVNAVVQEKLFEQLGGWEDVRLGPHQTSDWIERGWLDPAIKAYHLMERQDFVTMVREYNFRHDVDIPEFERTIEEFVADVILDEYARKRQYKRTTLATGSGLFFGGPVGAGAAAALYTTYSRESLIKFARRQLADTYGLGLRYEGYDLVRAATDVDIMGLLTEAYPGRWVSDVSLGSPRRYEPNPPARFTGTTEVGELSTPLNVWRDPHTWVNIAGTTEAGLYRQLLKDQGLVTPAFMATRLNFQIGRDIGAEAYRRGVDRSSASTAQRPSRVATHFDEDARYTLYMPAFVTLSQIQRTNVYINASALSQKIIVTRFHELAADVGMLVDESWTPAAISPVPASGSGGEVMGIPSSSFIPSEASQVGGLVVEEYAFLSAKQVNNIMEEHGGLIQMADELQTTIKNRNEAARLLANRAKLVDDYQRKIVGDFKEDLPEAAGMLEESSALLDEWGYGSTQIGSTRIDPAFGNTPQMQEIWRRQIAANPMARAQLDAEADIQRRYERFQGAHQYDVMNQYEAENFARAWDDFMTRHIVPKDFDKTNVAQQYWAKIFDFNSSVDDVVQWMLENKLTDRLPDEWNNIERLEQLVIKTRYEANSLLPGSLDVFDEARARLSRGESVEWGSHVTPALMLLNERINTFWDFFDNIVPRRLDGSGVFGPDSIDDLIDEIIREFSEQDMGTRSGFAARWNALHGLDPDLNRRPFDIKVIEEMSTWDDLVSGLHGPDTLDIIKSSFKSSFERTARGRELTPAVWTEIRRNAQNRPIVQQIRDAAETVEDYSVRGTGDFGKVVTDSSFIDAMQTKNIYERYKSFLDGIFENLTMVEDYLSRGTLFESIYASEVADALQLYRIDDAATDSRYQISTIGIRRLVDKSRRNALSQTKDLLYDLANRSKFEDLVAELSPFFGAWQEVTTRWFGLAAENPVFVFRMLRLWSVITAEDQNGQTKLVFQLPDVFGTKFDTHLPFISDRLFGEMSILSEMPLDLNVGSASMISAFAGTGPIVSFAASELSVRNPDIYESLDFLLPYGLVEGGNAFERFASSHAPGWVKSAGSVIGLDTDRRAATAARVMVDYLAQNYEAGLEHGTDPLPNTQEAADDLLEEVERRTRMIYSMRMLRSLAVPVSYQQQSPYWAILSEFWRTEDEHGSEIADYWLLENHYELWAATARRTLADGAIAGSLEGHANYERHKEFTAEYPELGGFVTGEVGAMDVQFAYNKAIAQLERQEGRRSILDPEDFLHEAGSNLGWREYRVFRNSLTLELQKRMKAGGSGSLNATTNFDLWQTRREFVTDLARRNPMWGVEFHQVGDPITQRKILQGFRIIVKDEAFEQRPEIPVIQQYLTLHDGIGYELERRANMTGNRAFLRLSFSQNADLAREWDLGILRLLMYPDFGNIFDRYFSNLDTVTTSNLPEYAPATLRTGN
jgi:hypothetical protein